MCEALKAITAKAGNDARSPGAKGIGHSEVLRLVFARYGDAHNILAQDPIANLRGTTRVGRTRVSGSKLR
jgi:hypothetical protein